MSSFGCVLWWLVLGGLLGWLASWLFGRPAPVTVEKFVDRPVDRVVDRVVEKIVDRPVDRVVEKLVDNPMHLNRIGALEGEVALMAGLRTTINQLQSAPPKVVEKVIEKIVDRPVDRIVEKIVDRPVDRIVEKIVDRPVEKIVEKIVDRPVDRIVEKVVEKIVDRPVDRIVEKMVDNPAHLSRIKVLETEVAVIASLRGTISQLQSAPPKVVEKIVEKIVDRPVEKIVEKIVERPVDRIVTKMVDNPAHLSRIKVLEHDVGVIAGLRGRISQLESAPPKVVEKIVEKIVDRPVEKIVEKIVDRPVDRIVEKIVDRPVDRIVEKLVDNPVHLNRIRVLEGEVALIAGLRGTISQLQSAPPKVVEKIVDRPVDRIVEKIVDRPVEKIVERIVDRPVERIVEKIVDRPVEKIVEKIVDRPVDRIVEKLVDNPAQLSRIAALEAEIATLRVRSTTLDRAGATAANFKVRGMDDLEVIEGIGPKIAGLFHDAGIRMFWELAQTPQARMQQILDAAGPNYKLANPSTWARQADLAANNRWAELRKLQDDLDGGIQN
jgi:predicted flap endonuclease-1-like 5' DNA nuclease